MNIARTFFKNFAHPKGIWGRVVAWRLDISNKQANAWTLSLLDLHPEDHVLEIGFGSGQTLRLAAEKLTCGFVAGVDSSPTMLEIARKRNAQAISSGRLELKLGQIEALPYPDNWFDKAYTVEVINYLADPLPGLKELHRVIRPGGRVAIFFEPKEKFKKVSNLIEGIYQPYDADEVVQFLCEAGFSQVRYETNVFMIRKVNYVGLVALGEKDLGMAALNSTPAL